MLLVSWCAAVNEMAAELRKRPGARAHSAAQGAGPAQASQPDEEEVKDRRDPTGRCVKYFIYIAVGLTLLLCGAYGYKKYKDGPYKYRDYDGEILFTEEMMKEAKLAAASDANAPIYLSIVGHVFDVSNGRYFYGPGGGYEFFTFRDGSRAFVTGKFDEDGLTDDVEGLSQEECKGVYRWLTFFEDKEKYFYAGRLVGRFFDEKGQPTKALKDFIECAEVAQAEEEESARADRPAYCDSRWSHDEGSSVWCEGRREVPRRARQADGALGRCVCVKTEALEEQGDKLVEYEGCEPDSSMCNFK